MDKDKALEEFNSMQEQAQQPEAAVDTSAQAPQGQTPAETAYLEAIYEGKTSKLPLTA